MTAKHSTIFHKLATGRRAMTGPQTLMALMLIAIMIALLAIFALDPGLFQLGASSQGSSVTVVTSTSFTSNCTGAVAPNGGIIPICP